MFSAMMTIAVLLLLWCMLRARRSHKAIGRSVAWFDCALVMTLLGNLIMVGAHNTELTEIGCYINFVGMNVVMLSLMNFSAAYCKIAGQETKHRIPVFNYLILGADAIQIALNPFFGHAFTLDAMNIHDKIHYRIVPRSGYIIHMIVDYFILFEVFLIFLILVIRTSRIYREKYTVILVTMLIVWAWQAYNIISRDPIDSSMLGFGFFGIMVYYFAIQYRPLRFLDSMLSGIVSENPDAMFVFDSQDRCMWANEQGYKLLGFTYSAELDYADKALREKFTDIKDEGDEWNIEAEIGSGEEKKYYSFSKRTVTDDRGKTSGKVLSIRDNTAEQIKLKKEIYNACHDNLTGLYTREYLFESIRKRIEQRPDTTYMAVFVDVKNFKIVNDIFGNKFGDHAIKCIADLIRCCNSGNSVYGRLAGDTFGVLVPKNEFNEKELEKKLSAFIVRDGNKEHRVIIHLGVYEVSDTDIEVSVMYDRAHLALGTIDEQYNKHIAYYDNKLRDKVMWDQEITTSLEKAVRDKELRPYLQPIVNRDGKVVGAEALARWIHPKHGFLSPALFIPVFENNGMIGEVDRHMWRCACEILSGWDNDLFISVNISPKDFYYTDVAETICALVDEYKIDPARLRIEITESVMMSDTDDRLKVLDKLRERGFIVEMDDFGSGYSSLNLLKNIPVDVLKIDMMFLARSDHKNRARTIVRNIIRLSNELGIESLTEGVETKEQYEVLSEMGCSLFQGYHFSKPVSREEFEEKFM